MTVAFSFGSGASARAFAAFVLSCAVCGCSMGHLSGVGDNTRSAHESLRTRAAHLSQTAWDSVKSEGTRLSAWATILMEGSSAQRNAGLAASAQNGPAASYLALKAQTYGTGAERLAAVTRDVQAKTLEADAFIAFAQTVIADTRRKLSIYQVSDTQQPAQSERIVLTQDREVIANAVADLKSQRATFSEAEHALRTGQRVLDTTPLAAALAALELRITRLQGLGRAVSA